MENNVFGHLQKIYAIVLNDLVSEAKRYQELYPEPIKNRPEEVGFIAGVHTEFYFFDEELSIYRFDFGIMFLVLNLEHAGKRHRFSIRFGHVYNFVTDKYSISFSGYSIQPDDDYTISVKNNLAYKAMGILYEKYYRKLISDFSDEFWYYKLWDYCKDTYAEMTYKKEKKFDKQIVYEETGE